MKLVSKVLLTGAIALLSLNSCKKEEEENKTVKPTTGVMKLTLDGKEWKSNPYNEFRIEDGDTIYGTEAIFEGDSLLSITAVRFSDSSAVIGQFLLTPGRTGTYTGTTTADYGFVHVAKADFISLLDALLSYTTTYTFTITKWDATSKKFSATYSFTMTSSGGGKSNKVVTNGEITDMPYTVE
jgi:hypothetical protein